MSSDRIAMITAWVGRAAWVCVLAFGIGAFEPLTDADSASTWAVWGIGLVLAAMWAIGAAALAFRSTVTLTVIRTVIPVAIVFALWRWIGGGPALDAIATLFAGGVASAAVMNADLGNSYVQASAYGAERRALLRPPTVYLGLTIVHWLAAAAACVTAFAALGSQRWWIGFVFGGLGVVLAVTGWPRWHKLARRWLVLVPVGLVFHDHVVLADTLMVGRRKLASLRLHGDHSDDALDITGGSTGPTVEVQFNDLETVTMAATPSTPAGRAFHARSVTVAPSRPGRFLIEAHRARLAVVVPDDRSALKTKTR